MVRMGRCASSPKDAPGLRVQGPRSEAGMTAIPSCRRYAWVPVVTTIESIRSSPSSCFSHFRWATSTSRIVGVSFTSMASIRWSGRSTIRSTSRLALHGSGAFGVYTS